MDYTILKTLLCEMSVPRYANKSNISCVSFQDDVCYVGVIDLQSMRTAKAIHTSLIFNSLSLGTNIDGGCHKGIYCLNVEYPLSGNHSQKGFWKLFNAF